MAVAHAASATIDLSISYQYDVFGQRINQSVDGDGVGSNPAVVTRFAYDNAQDDLANVWADLDGTDSLTTRRVFGYGIDQPLARLAGSTVHWYLADRQGSIRELANNTTGALVYQATYGGFGTIESEPLGTTQRDRYLYAAREFIAEVNLYYYRARPYDPNTGRFFVEDQVGFSAEDPNLYRYVRNQATNATDPSGNYVYVEDYISNSEYGSLTAVEFQKIMLKSVQDLQARGVQIGPYDSFFLFRERESGRVRIDLSGVSQETIDQIIRYNESVGAAQFALLVRAARDPNTEVVILPDPHGGLRAVVRNDAANEALRKQFAEAEDPEMRLARLRRQSSERYGMPFGLQFQEYPEFMLGLIQGVKDCVVGTFEFFKDATAYVFSIPGKIWRWDWKDEQELGRRISELTNNTSQASILLMMLLLNDPSTLNNLPPALGKLLDNLNQLLEAVFLEIDNDPALKGRLVGNVLGEFLQAALLLGTLDEIKKARLIPTLAEKLRELGLDSRLIRRRLARLELALDNAGDAPGPNRMFTTGQGGGGPTNRPPRLRGSEWVVEDSQGNIVGRGATASEAAADAARRTQGATLQPPRSTGNWGAGSHPSAAESLDYHYGKHGAEVGATSVEDYLRKAQAASEARKGAGTPVPGATPNVRRFDVHGSNRYVDVDVSTGQVISYGSK